MEQLPQPVRDQTLHDRHARTLLSTPNDTPYKTAGLIKKVYAYRSLIVHGQVKHEKKRIVDLGGEKFLATDVANYLLRQILKAMLKEPSLIDQIDDDRVVFEMIDQWTKREALDDAPEPHQDLR